ncbi:MAG: hypothetical protein AAF317_13970, partial [Pseudomonadota bacterium]
SCEQVLGFSIAADPFTHQIEYILRHTQTDLVAAFPTAVPWFPTFHHPQKKEKKKRKAIRTAAAVTFLPGEMHFLNVLSNSQ